MTFRWLNVFLSLLGALWISCGALGADSPDPATAVAQNPVKEDYVIQPSDLLQVQIFQEDDLTRQVRVTQGSAISLPLIGSVSLKDMTIKQAQIKIHDLYDANYLVDPQVTVSVLEYAKRNVNVIGAVNSPGAVPFPQEEGLTLLDAIARSGGFNRFADRKKIKLSRTDADGHTQTYIINADDLMQSGTNDAWPLKRDDVIFVPERIL